MSLPLLFDRSWLESLHAARRQGLELVATQSRSSLVVACPRGEVLPASFLGKPLRRFEIEKGGMEDCAVALAGWREPMEILLPHVSDDLKMAALLLQARGELKEWRLSRWPSNATDPSKARQFHVVGQQGKRKTPESPWVLPAGILEPWRIGLTIVGDDDLKGRDLAVLGAYFRDPVCRVDQVWLVHFQGESTKVAALLKRWPWKVPTQILEVGVERGSRQYEAFPTDKLRDALRAAIPDIPPGKAPEFAINFCRGREPVKLALLELAVDGHLPGSWIVADPARRDQPERSRLLDPTRLPRLASVLEQEALREIDQAMAAITDQTVSLPLLQARRAAWRAAQGDLTTLAPVLLLGQTGTGKSHLAQAMSKVRAGLEGRGRTSPFREINCAHFGGNPDLLLSALFGHRKGAFSGADRDRQGAFRAADGGILFLDEVGEIPLAAQSLLLKALDRPGERGTWVFSPLGTEESESSSFLLVCGTNRDLEDDVEQGRFRRDLLERIRHRTIALPTLSERLQGDPSGREGLEMLAAAWGPSGPRVLGRGRDSLIGLLASHSWPGNHREFLRWAQRLHELSVLGMIGEDQVAASRDVLDRRFSPSPRIAPQVRVSERHEILRIADGNNAAVYWLAVGAGLEPEGQSNPSMRGKLLRAQWESEPG